MFWYAQLNENDIVIEIHPFPVPISDPNFIAIPEEDRSLIGKKYNRDTGEFEDVETDLDAKIDKVASDLKSHIEDQSNPHVVTKAQVGLSQVDNTSDLAKPVSVAVQAALDALAEQGGKKYETVVIGSTASGHTMHDVDYLCTGTNDADIIQAALASLTKGTVKFLEGSYTIGKAISVAAGINLVGSGYGNTTLNNADIQLAGQNLVSGIHFNEGFKDFILRAVGNNTTIQNCSFYASARIENCIYGNAAANLIVRDNYINATNRDGVRMTGDYSVCENNHIIAWEGLQLSGNNCVVSGNIMECVNRCFYTSWTNGNVISGNRMISTTTGNYAAVAIQCNSSVVCDFTVVGNIIQSPYRGIEVSSGRIGGGIIGQNSIRLTAAGTGINLSNSRYLSVNGNSMVSTASSASAIRMESSTNCTISGNNATLNLLKGIFLDNESSNNAVVGNVAFVENAGAGNVVANNK